MEKKSLALLSETSLNDPRLHHEVTLVVIDLHPNSPWKHYASLNKKINTSKKMTVEDYWKTKEK